MTIAASIPATATASAAVRAQKLGKAIDGRPILQELSFEVAPGQFLALLGANGAGKSTLLKILATLTLPSSGSLHLFGQNVQHATAKVRARIGLIGHQSMLYRDLSAWENLVFFGRLYGLGSVEKRAEELLGLVGLADRAEDPVKAFSRGMTQRLAIARALMHEPNLLLADEPFAGLDVPSSLALERLLAQLHQRGQTVVMVNHDIPQSLRLAQRAIVLRRGRIVMDQPTQGLEAAVVVQEVSQS